MDDLPARVIPNNGGIPTIKKPLWVEWLPGLSPKGGTYGQHQFTEPVKATS